MALKGNMRREVGQIGKNITDMPTRICYNFWRKSGECSKTQKRITRNMFFRILNQNLLHINYQCYSINKVTTGEVPKDWKAMHISKKVEKSDTDNHRVIILLITTLKWSSKAILEKLQSSLKINAEHYEFLKNWSSTYNTFIFCQVVGEKVRAIRYNSLMSSFFKRKWSQLEYIKLVGFSHLYSIKERPK